MTRTTAAPSDRTPALAPKLRFPEFRKAPGWAELPLEQLGEFVCDRISVSGLSRTDYVSTENLLPEFRGFSPPSSFPGGGSVVHYRVNDILAANIRPYLKKIWLADRSGGASNDVIVIRAKDSAGPQFLAHALKNDRFIAYVMSGAKGLKMPRGDVSLIKEYPVPTPSPAEQKKIAECLSSLDELIGAESQKLAALKVHKEGLMQQLFPREGESLPRLRLPELNSAPDWKEMKLGDLVEIRSGQSPSQYNLSTSGRYAFVKVEDLNNCIKYQEKAREYSDDTQGIIPSGSVLFPKRGAAIELNKVRICAQPLLADTNMMALTPRDECEPEFLYYLLSCVGLSKIADNSTIPQINNKHIVPFKITLPRPTEQRRIATCLSSLDELIAAQRDRLSSLQTHKQGLMQQLFPASAETEV